LSVYAQSQAYGLDELDVYIRCDSEVLSKCGHLERCGVVVVVEVVEEEELFVPEILFSLMR
jgi:hypothetical protein